MLNARRPQIDAYLEEALANFPAVKIVLSTSWVSGLGLGYSKAIKHLPIGLQRRVIGATYHSKHTPEWRHVSRFYQILEHVCRHGLGQNWIAVDNDADGWLDMQFDRLVHTDDYAGLGSAAAQEDLRRKLKALCEPQRIGR